MQRLASHAIGRFPVAMSGPLVAAGICGPDESSFIAVGVNVMRVLPGTGYAAVHAEEVVIGEMSMQEVGPVTLVVSLEPCRARQGPDAVPCCARVADFARSRKVRQVVVGLLDTGKGLGFMLRQGVRVAICDGPEHRSTRGSNTSSRLAELEREYGVGKPPALEVIQVPNLDAINRESRRRMEAASLERRAQVERLLTLIGEGRDPIAVIAGGVAGLGVRDRSRLSELLIAGQSMATPLPEWLRDWVESLVYRTWARERAMGIEREVRQREDANG